MAAPVSQEKASAPIAFALCRISLFSFGCVDDRHSLRLRDRAPAHGALAQHLPDARCAEPRVSARLQTRVRRPVNADRAGVVLLSEVLLLQLKERRDGRLDPCRSVDTDISIASKMPAISLN